MGRKRGRDLQEAKAKLSKKEKRGMNRGGGGKGGKYEEIMNRNGREDKSFSEVPSRLPA
jgi:hypothetical protein